MNVTRRAPARSPAQKAAVLGLMAAAAIVISALESALPAMPFLPPGAKLGLSNIVTMYAALCFPLPYALCIAAVKAAFVLCVRGGAAFLMSFAGGMLSVLALWCAARSRLFGLLGIGAVGGLTHNLAQLFAAMLLVGGAAVYYLPVLLLCGAVAGCVTAFLLRLVLPALGRCFSPRAQVSAKRDTGGIRLP